MRGRAVSNNIGQAIRVDALLDEAQGVQCVDEQHLVPYNLLNIWLF